jgi:hypothetical protein
VIGYYEGIKTNGGTKMGKKSFEIKVEMDDRFMDLLGTLAKNDGFETIDEWMVHEMNENIYEIINANLKGWGFDKYGEKLTDLDEFGNYYDSVGDLVA